MPSAWALVVAAGMGRRMRAGRFKTSPRKSFLELRGKSVLIRTVESVAACPDIEGVVVAVSVDDLAEAERVFAPFLETFKIRSIVPGGAERQDSVAAALAEVPAGVEFVAVHDGARPFVSPALFTASIEAAARTGAAVVSLPAIETLRRVSETGGRSLAAGTVDRSEIWSAQTPQTCRAADLRRLLDQARRDGAHVTDEASLFERAGLPVEMVRGERRNIKITTPEDMDMAEALVGEGERSERRVGTGWDLHRLVEGRALVLGGVELPSEKGALGHSDADALAHAIIDALLGAAALGDIGGHFPDTDPRYKGADSLVLLAESVRVLREAGYRPVSVDSTVIIERPKLAPHIPEMRRFLAERLGLDVTAVSVKAKTSEGLGEVGRGEAVTAQAVAVVERI